MSKTGASPKTPTMEEVFSENGILSKKLASFEYRSQQENLARSVWDVLESGRGEILLAEAPTGTGKTHALLVPAIYWSLRNDTRVLFLTSGIPLQEQIVRRDLPELCRCLGIKDLPFGLVKGKSNYLCRLRGKELSSRELMPLLEPEAAAELQAWMESTETGDFSEISLPPSHPVISAVAAGSDICRGNACPFRETCFLKKVFQQAADWRITIANYHLFFSYSASVDSGFPVPFDAVVCDEAHRLTEAARTAATRRSSAEDWLRLLDYGRARVIPGLDWLPSEKVSDGISATERVRRDAETLFSGWKRKMGHGEVFGTGVFPPDGAEELIESAEEMLRIVGKPPETTEKDKNREKHAAELAQWREGMLETMDSFRWCAAVGRFPEWAYWWDGRSIFSAPSDCSGFIREWFFPKPIHALVAVSATMAIGNDFSFWESETGLRSTEKMVLDSPFPLEEQMKVWIVDMGLRVTDNDYDKNVAAVVETLCEENGGSTLVLLSSMRLMRIVAEKLGKTRRKWPLLIQGELPRNELLRRFREEISSVLVGSVSFREGIDVPGEGLTQVIIDRIPFPHPGDPLLVTRRAMEGPSIFTEMILPLAKLLLKQAAGRLIRSRTDRGKVVILDGRVLGRPDWKITEALPKVVYRRVKISVNGETLKD